MHPRLIAVLIKCLCSFDKTWLRDTKPLNLCVSSPNTEFSMMDVKLVLFGLETHVKKFYIVGVKLTFVCS